MNPIVIGYTSAAIPNIWEHVPEPEPTTTRTKPESIAEWRQTIYPVEKAQMKQTFEQAASKIKLLGHVVSIAAFELSDAPLHRTPYFFDGVDPVTAFMTWMTRVPVLLPDTILYGINLKPFVRMTGVEMLRLGRSMPLSWWYKNDNCYDPYEMLVEAEHRRTIDRRAAAKLLGLGPLKKDYQENQNALTDLLLTVDMLTKLGHPDAVNQLCAADVGIKELIGNDAEEPLEPKAPAPKVKKARQKA